MDIRFLARRLNDAAAHSSKSDGAQARQTADAGQVAQAAQAAQPTAASSGQGAAASGTDTAEQPATISRFTPAGRLLNVLQSFEARHPDETKQALSNIADKLRSDAERAGPFSERLTKWADRFQEAADSGDMSKLMPRLSSHFGVRAYQQAEQPDHDDTVEHVAGTAETHSAATPPAATSGAPARAEPSKIASAPEPATTGSSDVRAQPDGSTAERASDIRNRPVTVPESSTKEHASSDIRNRPVTVPESSRLNVTE